MGSFLAEAMDTGLEQSYPNWGSTLLLPDNPAGAHNLSQLISIGGCRFAAIV